MIETSIPVLIVGGGPVGLTLSIDLSKRGVRSLLVDSRSREARAEHPRMDQVSIRSMEHIRRWGELEEVYAAGYPREMTRDTVFATAVLGYELEREPMQADAIRPSPQFSPQKHELCPQNFFDPALQRIALRQPLSSLRYNVKLVGFLEREDGVVARLEDVETGMHTEVFTQFLAACDGANSFVAKELGFGSRNEALLAQSTNVFVRSPALTELANTRPAYRYVLIGEEGVWGSMVNLSGRDVWRLQVLNVPDEQPWSDAEVHAAIVRAIGAQIEYELLSIVPWLRREMVRDRFASERCFLVGDAAHQLSPTGGYGMTTGMGEAFDLSWKLAAVLQGWGGNDLLGSYEAERRPVALRNVAFATANFRRMCEVRKLPGLFGTGQQGEAVRAHAGKAIREAMGGEWESMGIHLGYSYEGSPIVVTEETSPPADSPFNYRQTSRPGARAPHVWLKSDQSTLDLFGSGFVLLVFTDRVDPEPLRQAAELRGVPLRIERIDHEAAARAYERAMVLVRPDGHVAWRGDSLDQDALAIIDRVRGRTYKMSEESRAVQP